MTIQIPNPGTGVPADKTGDSPWLAMEKVAANFSNQTHAASRLVGPATGNLLEANNAFGLGISPLQTLSSTNLATCRSGFCNVAANNIAGLPSIGYSHFGIAIGTGSGGTILCAPYPEINAVNAMGYNFLTYDYLGNVVTVAKIYTNKNTTRDSNGFLKTASPVVDLYSDRVELNQDAEHQGGINFEKLGVGDYLVKGSLGFAKDGWYIEMPKDANGNVMVAVVYEQLTNNDISIKTYAKKFDDETGDIVANLLKPRDIPAGRFISLRLHELPKEPPVMPMDETTAEV